MATILMCLAQGVIFVKAWRLSASVRHLSLRIILRILLAALSPVLLAGILDPFTEHIFSRWGWPDWVLAASRAWLFASFLGLLAMGMLRAASRLAMYAVPVAERKDFDRSRRRFLRYGLSLAGGSPLLGVAYGYSSRLDYRIVKVQAPVAHLPVYLDGLRIVQISDIHMGDFMTGREVRRAVDIVNQLRPDLVVVTGDFISRADDPLELCIMELSRLQAPLGIWGCNGNHEMMAGVEHLSQTLFHRYGMTLLRQQNEILQWRGAKINLIGVDYQKDKIPFMRMLGGLESLVRRDMPNILLSHNPNSFYRAAGLGIELSLAGHTHGGQIRIGIAGACLNPARFYTEFVEGMYSLADRQSRAARLYVNRGLGTIWIPVRFEVPPEITLLTLCRVV